MRIIAILVSVLLLAVLLRAWLKLDWGEEKPDDGGDRSPEKVYFPPDPVKPDDPKVDDAMAEIDRKYILRDHNADLLDAIEDELNRASGKRRTALLRQRVTVEQRIFNLDKQIDQLFRVIYGGDD